MPQPALERAPAWIVAEFRHGPGQRDDRLLHDFLRLLLSQPAFAGHLVKQLPVEIKKLPPTLVIIPVAQSAEQALARREEFALVRRSGHLPFLIAAVDGFFQGIS